MPNAATFFDEPTRYLIVLAGEPGSGKTRAALSFPDCYVICCDPRGIEILKEPSNAPFRKNLIWYDYFALEAKADATALFKRSVKADDESSIYGALERIKQMAEKGKIKTVVLDGFSYLADFLEIKLTQTHAGTTEGDRWAYYRQLKNDLVHFTQCDLWTLTRYGLNVIVTVHIQRESEEAQKKRADTQAEIQPRIAGGFRSALAGMPRAMIYMDALDKAKTEQVNGQPKKVYSMNYFAYCRRVKIAHLGLIPAKNSYGLPSVVNVTDKSFYDVLEAAMEEAPAVAQPKTAGE